MTEDDGFVAKYDAAGAVQWAHQIGSYGADAARCLAIGTNGHVFVTGIIQGTVVLDPTHTLADNGFGDVFVVEYDNDGAVVSARKFGGPGVDSGASVDVAPDGGVFVGGSFGAYFNGSGGSATFGEGDRQVTLYTGGQSPLPKPDAFVAKFEPSGELAWVVPAGGAAEDGTLGIAADPNGNCYAVGIYIPPAGFANPYQTTVISNGVTGGLWLAKLGVTPRVVNAAVNGRDAVLTLSGPRSFEADLQVSSDWSTWQDIGRIVFQGTNVFFTHTNAVMAGQRFYRLKSP